MKTTKQFTETPLKILLFLLTFSMGLSCISAQDQHAIDSLIHEANRYTGKDRAAMLINLYWHYRGRDNEKAAAVSDEALDLALKSGDQPLIAKAYHVKGMAKESFGEFREALHFLNLYLETAIALNDTSEIAGALNSLGNLNHSQSNYDQALDFYMRRISFLKEVDAGAMATNYNNIGMIHEAIDNYPKSLEYFHKALDLHKATGNKKMEGGTMVNIGVIYFNMKEYTKALEYYEKSAGIIKKVDDKMILSIIYESMGNIYREQKKYGEAIVSYQTSLSLSEELKDDYGIASVLRNLGETYMLQQKYEAAVRYLLKGHDLSASTGGKSFLLNAKRLLAQTYSEMNDHKTAYRYQSEYQALKDSLFNETKNKQIQELQMKYESEKKDREIMLLNVEKELQEAALYEERMARNVSIGGFMLIAVIAFLLIKSYREKINSTRALAAKSEEINRQQLLQLEKDRKLEVMDAVINGEEKERKRIAKDLHDGLSGLLAAIKMQFNSIQQESATIGSQKFSQALRSLDKASGEVRRIAHNMMPQLLMKFGLIEALSEFINNIRLAHGLNITFTHFGMDQRLEPVAELSLYRAIQELIHNIVKHANATEVVIQVSRTRDMLMVTVEDNGDGFDTSTIDRSDGIGIGNIKSRIQYLGGKVTIDSATGKGTAVYIEVELTYEPVSEI